MGLFLQHGIMEPFRMMFLQHLKMTELRLSRQKKKKQRLLSGSRLTKTKDASPPSPLFLMIL